MSDLKSKIQEAMKDAMRAKETVRLATIRLIMAAFKQHEVDNRTAVDDDTALAILDKLVKQRRESITQFEAGDRQDLADKEKVELEVIQTFLPEQLSADEINSIISEAIKSTGAESVKDMGKVMGIIKPQMQGRADMSIVSKQIKEQLA